MLEWQFFSWKHHKHCFFLLEYGCAVGSISHTGVGFCFCFVVPFSSCNQRELHCSNHFSFHNYHLRIFTDNATIRFFWQLLVFSLLCQFLVMTIYYLSYILYATLNDFNTVVFEDIVQLDNGGCWIRGTVCSLLVVEIFQPQFIFTLTLSVKVKSKSSSFVVTLFQI